MGKSLPVLNSFFNSVSSLGSSAVSRFESLRQGTDGPGDGRTVDDFKPYLVALNLTKRCNLKCDHCYLDQHWPWRVHCLQ